MISNSPQMIGEAKNVTFSELGNNETHRRSKLCPEGKPMSQIVTLSWICSRILLGKLLKNGHFEEGKRDMKFTFR
jgi:hypothetical protein